MLPVHPMSRTAVLPPLTSAVLIPSLTSTSYFDRKISSTVVTSLVTGGTCAAVPLCSAVEFGD